MNESEPTATTHVWRFAVVTGRGLSDNGSLGGSEVWTADEVEPPSRSTARVPTASPTGGKTAAGNAPSALVAGVETRG